VETKEASIFFLDPQCTTHTLLPLLPSLPSLPPFVGKNVVAVTIPVAATIFLADVISRARGF